MFKRRHSSGSERSDDLTMLVRASAGDDLGATQVNWFGDFIANHRSAFTIIDERDLKYTKPQLIAAFELQIRLVEARVKAGFAHERKHLEALQVMRFHVGNDIHRLLPEDRETYLRLRHLSREQVTALADRSDVDPSARADSLAIIGMGLKYADPEGWAEIQRDGLDK